MSVLTIDPKLPTCRPSSLVEIAWWVLVISSQVFSSHFQVCIIDDREDVWNFAPNLVHVKPYHFFKHTGDINAPPGLAKKENDEKVGVDFDKIEEKLNNKPPVDFKGKIPKIFLTCFPIFSLLTKKIAKIGALGAIAVVQTIL